MRNLAIIPARSGSKGLKDKNILELNGKPLLAYSIEAAVDSALFVEIMVSTDSEEYASLARRYGASVPFLRSEDTSGDKASTWDMVKEVITCYKNNGVMFDSICVLQPTSPLRIANDIVAAYDILNKKGANAVVSVCKAEHSPMWSNVLPDNLCLKDFISESVFNQGGRQNFGEYYRLNGAIYISKINYESLKIDLYNELGYAYIMPTNRSIDIDTADDFELAEFYIRKKEKDNEIL